MAAPRSTNRCAVLALLAIAWLLTVGGGLASAVGPPTAYTGEATQLTTSSAVLKGAVYPGGQQTSYYFQYGTSTAYGAQTPVATLDAGTQSINVVAPLSDLEAGATYHCRLVAVNAGGTALGQDRTFSVKKVPLVVQLDATHFASPFGTPFVVSGSLSGTGSAAHLVVLQANPFPYLAGFKPLGRPQPADASGRFSFTVPGQPVNTQLRIATLDTPPLTSRVTVELVAVHVTLHIGHAVRAGYARLYGSVTPGEPGARIVFQRVRRGHPAESVAETFITSGSRGSSRFAREVRLPRPGLYRAAVEVTSGAQTSGHSRALLIR